MITSGHYPTEAPAPEGASMSSGAVAAPASAPVVANAWTPRKPEEGGDPPGVAMPTAEPPGEGSSSHDKPHDSPEIKDKSPMAPWKMQPALPVLHPNPPRIRSHQT